MNGYRKFDEGTIVKWFDQEDQIMNWLIQQEITESQAWGENIEELAGWIEIRYDEKEDLFDFVETTVSDGEEEFEHI